MSTPEPKKIQLPKLQIVRDIPPRKKILLLSDDLRMHSGIATMSKEFVIQTSDHFNWVQLGAALEHPDHGKIFDISAEVNKERGIDNSSVRIYAHTGYGNADVLREIIALEKPDAILHFTDPRFWEWLYMMEHDIRSHYKIPIMYYNIWDAPPAPFWNKPFYSSCDLIMNISKQTHALVKTVLGEELYNDLDDNTGNGHIQLAYVPHGINAKKYYPINVGDDEYEDYLTFATKFKTTHDVKFIVFWNNRNIRRKQPGDVVLAFRQFCEMLPDNERKDVALFMHTDMRDPNGTDLPEVVRVMCPNYKVIFNEERLPVNVLNYFYNMSDTTLNMSCVPPGTQIMTHTGLRAIETVQQGEMVLTHLGRYREVVNIFENNNVDCDMVRITASCMKIPIELTVDHPVLCVRKTNLNLLKVRDNTTFTEYIEWVKAGDVEKSDLVFLPNIHKDELIFENITFSLKDYCRLKTNNKYPYIVDDKLFYAKDKFINTTMSLDTDLAYLMGRWVGDGYTTTISFDNKYGEDEINKCGEIYVKKFGGLYKIAPHYQSKNCSYLKMFGSECTIINFFNDVCRVGKEKTMPNCILYNSNIEILKSFIDGLYASDGSRYDEANIDKLDLKKIVNCSIILKQQLILGLIRLGKHIRIDYNYSGYTGKRNGYHFMWNDNRIDNNSSRSWYRDDKYVMSVYNVEKYKYTGKVHNIEVLEDNSYVCESFIVHNSNEGWGLTTAESIMSGTPTIVNVTGGLQDQVRFTDVDGNWVNLDSTFTSNHTGVSKTHGEWAKVVYPTNRSLQGSLATPYILDDRCDFNDVAKQIYQWYITDPEVRSKNGIKGREWMMSKESGMSSVEMGNRMVKHIDTCLNTFEPKHKYEIFVATDRDKIVETGMIWE